jgi:hypothetical protein
LQRPMGWRRRPRGRLLLPCLVLLLLLLLLVLLLLLRVDRWVVSSVSFRTQPTARNTKAVQHLLVPAREGAGRPVLPVLPVAWTRVASAGRGCPLPPTRRRRPTGRQRAGHAGHGAAAQGPATHLPHLPAVQGARPPAALLRSTVHGKPSAHEAEAPARRSGETTCVHARTTCTSRISCSHHAGVQLVRPRRGSTAAAGARRCPVRRAAAPALPKAATRLPCRRAGLLLRLQREACSLLLLLLLLLLPPARLHPQRSRTQSVERPRASTSRTRSWAFIASAAAHRSRKRWGPTGVGVRPLPLWGAARRPKPLLQRPPRSRSAAKAAGPRPAQDTCAAHPPRRRHPRGPRGTARRRQLLRRCEVGQGAGAAACCTDRAGPRVAARGVLQGGRVGA